MKHRVEYRRCIDFCGECPHYTHHPVPDTAGVYLCAAISLDGDLGEETIDRHPLVPAPTTPRLRYCPVRSGDNVYIGAPSGTKARAPVDPKRQEEIDRLFAEVDYPVVERVKDPRELRWEDSFLTGEKLRIYPFGFPERTAVATVELSAVGEPHCVAISFREPPPFVGTRHGFPLASRSGHPVMLLFRQLDPDPDGVPVGPWIDAADSGHYIIERIDRQDGEIYDRPLNPPWPWPEPTNPPARH